MQEKVVIFSQAVTMYFLFCILPTMNPEGEQWCVTCDWTGQLLRVFCCCIM